MHRIWNRLFLAAAVCLLCETSTSVFGQGGTDPYMPRAAGPTYNPGGGSYREPQGPSAPARAPAAGTPRYQPGGPTNRTATGGYPAASAPNRGGVYTPPPRRSVPAVPRAKPRAPFQLNAAETAYLDKILNFWEYKSGQITTFDCQFTRWDYDSTLIRDPNTARSISRGEIRYGSPDKGSFKVDEVRPVVFPKDASGRLIPNAKPVYKPDPGAHRDHWICDGQKVFEFDSLNKQINVQELPDSMKGKAISDGPLPFVFGAKAAKMKERYWIRPVKPPAGSKGEYWLEAYPKRQQDAANYKRIEIILDEKDFLPKALQMYMPGGNERQVFQFSDRNVNAVTTRLGIWIGKSFACPSTPSGWRRVNITNQTPPPGMAHPRPTGPAAASRPGYSAPSRQGGTPARRF